MFDERGYSGARLTDISARAGLTTGAFYRHFSSKSDFFAALFTEYGQDLICALDAASSLSMQIEGWLLAARQHRGVVRATQEVARIGTGEDKLRSQLRAQCALLLSKHMEELVDPSMVSMSSELVADVVAQYALIESAGWVPMREAQAVATELDCLIRRGLYGP